MIGDGIPRRLGGLLRITNGGYWPILLKKSASVSTAETEAPEIEICVCAEGSGLGFYVQRAKEMFQPSIFERFGQTDFFNSIGRFQTVTTGSNQPDLDILQNDCSGATILTRSFSPMLMRGSVE